MMFLETLPKANNGTFFVVCTKTLWFQAITRQTLPNFTHFRYCLYHYGKTQRMVKADAAFEDIYRHCVLPYQFTFWMLAA
jgi:hypothetical protein